MKRFVGWMLFLAWVLPGRAELLPPEIGVGWANGWVQEWRKTVPGLEVTDSGPECKNIK